MWPKDIPTEFQDGIVTGDVLEFLSRIPDNSVPMYLFSPPYNLSVSTGGGFVGKRSFKRSGKWDGGNLADGYTEHDDAMTPEGYKEWQKKILRECWRTLDSRGAIFYQHKPRIQNLEVHTPLEYNPDLPIRQIIIWARAGGVNFSQTHYCPTHEWIVVFAKPDFKLKSKGASGVGDVWQIAQEMNSEHPAPYPLKLAMMALETVMPVFVVDPFSGSGTTCVAAKTLGVHYIGNDSSEKYNVKARLRLANTNPLVFTLPDKQIEMAL